MVDIKAVILLRAAKQESNLHRFYEANGISPPSSLFNALTDTYYFAKNVDGQFVYANKLLNEQYKITNPSEVIGKTDYDFFRTDIADNIRVDDLNVIENDIVISNKLEIVHDENGHIRWLFTTKSPLKNADGEIVGIEGFSRDAQKSQTSNEPYHIFKEVIEYVRKNLANPIKISDLANMCFMSLSTFERKFKIHFSCTPNQYIKRCRVQEGCRLLLTGSSIQQVSLATGFCDQSHFTREFKNILGLTPRAYQQQSLHPL